MANQQQQQSMQQVGGISPIELLMKMVGQVGQGMGQGTNQFMGGFGQGLGQGVDFLTKPIPGTSALALPDAGQAGKEAGIDNSPPQQGPIASRKVGADGSVEEKYHPPTPPVNESVGESSTTPGVKILPPKHAWTQSSISQGPDGQIIQQGGPLDISGQRVKDAMEIASSSQKMQGKEPMQQGVRETLATQAVYAGPTEATGALNSLVGAYEEMSKAIPAPLRSIGFQTRQMRILSKNINELSQRPSYTISRKEETSKKALGSDRMQKMIAEARKRGLI